MNRQGDFDKVFKLYYEPMYFFARHFVDEEETCRDLVMDVFEDLWRHRDGVEAVTAKSWLLSTCAISASTICGDNTGHGNTK